MSDDDRREPAPDGAEAGERLLREQQARIAALRAAVLAGHVPDDEAAFDYERFFDRRAAGDASTG